MTKTVLRKKPDTKANSKSPISLVEAIFNLQLFKKDRDKDVIFRRFGLFGHARRTLDQIGKTLGVTRERVRQIEKKSLEKIVKNREQETLTENFNKKVKEFFKENILVGEEELYKLIGKQKISNEDKDSINFLLTLIPDLKYIKGKTNYRNLWIKKDVKESDIEKIIKNIESILSKQGALVKEKEIVSTYKETSRKKVENILYAGKNLIKVGDSFGLKKWRSINPKSIYDKIVIILNNERKPLHYSDIHIRVNLHHQNNRKVSPKAVHNELIKNNEFILIGRGIYALEDWGYKKGTVEEIIIDILSSEKGPLHKDEIIKRVKERRIVKETTIVINLQKFNRVGKAVYSL